MSVLAVTGHRPDKLRVGTMDAYDARVYDGLVDFAYGTIEEEAPTLVVTGMALGWDQAVAHACATAGLPFIAAVPFKGQDEKWPPKSRKYYYWLLNQAREVRTVSEGGYSVQKLHARNRWMVENADSLLALWNGSEGGTAGCVRYATKQGKPITNVWGRWLAHTAQHSVGTATLPLI